MSALEQLVVRELTPRGPGAVSVIELCGPSTQLALQELVRPLPPVGGLQLVRLSIGEVVVDEALVWNECDGRAEVHLHASVPLVRRVLEHLGAGEGLAAARSIEACALEALARAPSEAGARVLLDQVEGALREELHAWLALEAGALRERALELDRHSRVARYAWEPARVVLAGPVNAGKSTLFNLIYGRERVVVSAQPGTTRDAVVERVQLGAWPVELVDTAGDRGLEVDRGPAGAVEALGQALAQRLRSRADVTLWLSPAHAPCRPPAPAPAAGFVIVESHGDRATDAPAPDVARISCTRDPRGALTLIARVVRERLALPENAWVPGRAIAFDERTRELVEAGRRVTSQGIDALRARVRAALEEGDPYVAVRGPIP